MSRKTPDNRSAKTLKQRIGRQAEVIAVQFLVQQGMTLVTQNFTCRAGEIDAILIDKDTIVFVEVRYRASNENGSAAESITPYKQRRIIKTALYWLQRHKCEHHALRFDAVLFDGNLHRDNLNWIKAAF